MSNKELLDWAVENVEEWSSKFKCLRSDRTGVFFTNKGGWRVKDDAWTYDGGSFNCYFRDYDTSVDTLGIQVITKEEWEAAKSTPKSFTKADLKTGMILEFNTGELAMVLRGTANGDIITGQTWDPLDCLAELGVITAPRSHGMQDNSVVKVYQPKNNMDYLNQGLHNNHPVIWKLDSNSEKRRELEKQIKELQVKLKELG